MLGRNHRSLKPKPGIHIPARDIWNWWNHGTSSGRTTSNGGSQIPFPLPQLIRCGSLGPGFRPNSFLPQGIPRHLRPRAPTPQKTNRIPLLLDLAILLLIPQPILRPQLPLKTPQPQPSIPLPRRLRRRRIRQRHHLRPLLNPPRNSKILRRLQQRHHPPPNLLSNLSTLQRLLQFPLPHLLASQPTHRPLPLHNRNRLLPRLRRINNNNLPSRHLRQTSRENGKQKHVSRRTLRIRRGVLLDALDRL